MTTWTLTKGEDIIKGGSTGGNTVVATAGTVNYRDQIDAGSGGGNTLDIVGGGLFDLTVPKVLTDIQNVTLQTGQFALHTVSGLIGGSRDRLLLRDGLDLTVTVTDGTPNTANLNPMGVDIVGGVNADVIDLDDNGARNHVVVGSAAETIDASGGGLGAADVNTIDVSAATIGATINGGSKNDTNLNVFGGGAVTMGDSISNIYDVTLENPQSGTFQPNYVFTANSQKNLIIYGSAGNDTITIGDASQAVHGGTGNDHVYATAAQAGALVQLGAGDNVLEITTGGVATLDTADNNLTVVLDDPATLTLSKGANVTAVGSTGADTIISEAKGQTLTGGGGADTLVGFTGGGTLFQDTTADINGVTIENFAAKGDVIDMTDFNPSGVKIGWVQDGASGTLTVSNGTQTASITLFGQFLSTGFKSSADSGVGTDIKYARPTAHTTDLVTVADAGMHAVGRTMLA
jgi:hypothetical protein